MYQFVAIGINLQKDDSPLMNVERNELESEEWSGVSLKQTEDNFSETSHVRKAAPTIP